MEGVVTKAAKVHKNNLSVSTEASALLRTLGMDPIASDAPEPSPSALPPPPPPSGGAVVTIETVTKASAFRVCVLKNRLVQMAGSLSLRAMKWTMYTSEVRQEMQIGWLAGGVWSRSERVEPPVLYKLNIAVALRSVSASGTDEQQ